MSTKLVCPDCGGIIGEASPGEAPCSCFPVSAADNAKSDTATMESFHTTTGRGDAAKRCLTCGKDVTGHRRVKDSRGYMCYACAKLERAGEREGKMACKECRRLVRPDGLVAYEGQLICKKCFGDHQEKARFRKKVSSKQYDEHEKRNLIILAVLVGILAMIVLYGLLFKHH